MRRSELRLFDISFINTIQRAIWYPYFDDMDAIIFLAPISCFDERLVEDKRVNRLEDTYMLWKTLCGLKLLAKTQIILFLNKVHSCLFLALTDRAANADVGLVCSSAICWRGSSRTV